MKEKIIFLGTPKISANLLKEMVDYGFNIVAVITQEDKLQGRKRVLTPSFVSQMATSLNIKTYKPHRLNKDFEFLKEIQPDLLLTFAYGQIISSEILSLSKYKPLNLHASLLPKYRGASPIQTALRNGETKTGVCLMEMIKELDAGAIYAKEELDISKDDNYTTLADRLEKLAFDIVKKYLPLYFENKLQGIQQDNNQATFCHMIKKEDEHLILNQGANEFVNQVRSLSLTPGGYLLLNDIKLKIYKASYVSNEILGNIGQIIFAKKKQLYLQLKDGIVNLDLLQKPGKDILNTQEFNNGNQNVLGSLLK